MYATGMELRVAYIRQHSQKCKSGEELKLQAVGTWVIYEVLSFQVIIQDTSAASCSSV